MMPYGELIGKISWDVWRNIHRCNDFSCQLAHPHFQPLKFPPQTPYQLLSQSNRIARVSRVASWLICSSENNSCIREFTPVVWNLVRAPATTIVVAFCLSQGSKAKESKREDEKSRNLHSWDWSQVFVQCIRSLSCLVILVHATSKPFYEGGVREILLDPWWCKCIFEKKLFILLIFHSWSACPDVCPFVQSTQKKVHVGGPPFGDSL